jgi:hypothetical protein
LAFLPFVRENDQKGEERGCRIECRILFGGILVLSLLFFVGWLGAEGLFWIYFDYHVGGEGGKERGEL